MEVALGRTPHEYQDDVGKITTPRVQVHNKHHHRRRSPRPRSNSPVRHRHSPQRQQHSPHSEGDRPALTVPIQLPPQRPGSVHAQWREGDVGKMTNLAKSLKNEEAMHRASAKYYYQCFLFLFVPGNVFLAFCGPGTVWSSISPDCSGTLSIPTLVFGVVATVGTILTGLVIQFKLNKKKQANETVANGLGKIHASVLLEIKKPTHMKEFDDYFEFIGKKLERLRSEHDKVSVPLHIRVQFEQTEQQQKVEAAKPPEQKQLPENVP